MWINDSNFIQNEIGFWALGNKVSLLIWSVNDECRVYKFMGKLLHLPEIVANFRGKLTIDSNTIISSSRFFAMSNGSARSSLWNTPYVCTLRQRNYMCVIPLWKMCSLYIIIRPSIAVYVDSTHIYQLNQVKIYPYFWFVANDFVHCALSIKCSTFAFGKERKSTHTCQMTYTHRLIHTRARTHTVTGMDFSVCLIRNVGLSIRLVEAIHLTWLSGVFTAGHLLCWTLRHSINKQQQQKYI